MILRINIYWVSRLKLVYYNELNSFRRFMFCRRDNYSVFFYRYSGRKKLVL